MEIAYDFSEIFSTEPIQRLDRAQLARYNPRKFWAVQKAIDTLGELSTQIQRFEEEPLCILDFYIHDSVQRKGNGHQLFDHMLRQEGTTAKGVAIDRPSDAFLQFLAKFYGLKKPVWQSTNFVVFPEFFEGKKPTHQNEHCGTGSRSEKFGSDRNEPLLVSQYLSTDRDAHGAGKDSVAGLLHGDNGPEFRRIAAPDTPLDRKNRRDFGHQSL
ncbi:hypothetical protein TELCIR_14179, partial [Teladorsagia circumcincta]